MKKMLFMAVLVIGGGAFMKNNLHVSPDGQVRLAGWLVPIPPSVQNSPVMGMITMMAQMQAAPHGGPQGAAPQAAIDPRTGAPQAVRPAVPNVTSGTTT